MIKKLLAIIMLVMVASDLVDSSVKVKAVMTMKIQLCNHFRDFILLFLHAHRPSLFALHEFHLCTSISPSFVAARAV
jgi:hypothetical protein